VQFFKNMYIIKISSIRGRLRTIEALGLKVFCMKILGFIHISLFTFAVEFIDASPT